MPIDTEESGESTAQVIEAMCLACIQEVSVDGGGVSLMTVQGYAGTVWASDATAHRIEELQFTLGEGPCHDAVRSGVPVLAPNLSGDNTDEADVALQARWPAFTPEVMHLGVKAIFGLPLRVGSRSLGAFDLYRQSSGPLSEEQIVHARGVADETSSALLDLDPTLGNRADQGARAAYHWVVHQAAGMLTQQLGVTVDEALVQLRATAFTEERSVDQIADDVVHRRRRFVKEET
jgi:GAF domain/ANTAR domain